MSESNEQNIWADKKMPALEFCKLYRAAELLEVKEEDILHWASLGAIELCLLFQEQEAYISPKGWQLKSIDIIEGILNEGWPTHHLEYSEEKKYKIINELSRELHGWFRTELSQEKAFDIEIDRNSSSRTFNFMNEDSWFGSFSINARATSIGWMCIPSEIFKDLGDRGVEGAINSFWCLPVTRWRNPFKDIAIQGYFDVNVLEEFIPVGNSQEDETITAYLRNSIINYSNYENRPTKLFTISKNDLYIMRADIELLYKNKGVTVNDYYHTIEGQSKEREDKQMKKIHGNCEYNARRREQLLMAAVYILSKYPDECRGTKKEISPEKWRNCLLSHRDEVPLLMITSEDVILKHLRAAVNGKGVEQI